MYLEISTFPRQVFQNKNIWYIHTRYIYINPTQKSFLQSRYIYMCSDPGKFVGRIRRYSWRIDGAGVAAAGARAAGAGAEERGEDTSF